MYKKEFGDLPLWQFDIFASEAGIKHFVSGRKGGISTGEKGELNLSYAVGDLPDNVLQNRQRIVEAMDIELSNLVFPKHIHGNQVVNVKDKNYQNFQKTDALITNVPGLLLATTAADCVPLLVYDPKNKAIGAVHAGWRGTVAQIITCTVESMAKDFGTDPVDLKVGIGPSICPQVYEVGEEVILEVYNVFQGEAKNLLIASENKGKAKFNLWEANKFQLMKLGTREENIEIAGICTYTNKDQFFSARASKNSGRFAAGILLLP